MAPRLPPPGRLQARAARLQGEEDHGIDSRHGRLDLRQRGHHVRLGSTFKLAREKEEAKPSQSIFWLALVHLTPPSPRLIKVRCSGKTRLELF